MYVSGVMKEEDTWFLAPLCYSVTVELKAFSEFVSLKVFSVFSFQSSLSLTLFVFSFSAHLPF